MEELVAAMGGVVTKQSLSKYERDQSVPAPSVMRAISRALGVSASRLLEEQAVEVEICAYRRKARMGRKEMARIESLTAVSLRDCVRSLWGLGEDPIACVLDTLEEHHIHVVEVDATDAFDGMSAVALTPKRRRGLPGERQRLGLTHELGHLVLDVRADVDAEKAAFRFGAAMLAPAQAVHREVGERRRRMDLQELLLLKKRYGLSVQALLYRLRDLQIITEGQYKSACIDINRIGWRREEPMPLPPERPTWLRQSVLRAVSEGVMGTSEGERMAGEAVDRKPALSLVQRRSLMAMSVEERRRHLKEQAERIAADYRPDADWSAVSGEDIVEY